MVQTYVLDLNDWKNNVPVRTLVDMVLLLALKDRATEVAFEPSSGEYRMSYRVDGSWYAMVPPPLHLAGAISHRLRIIADLAISTQFGSFQFEAGGGTAKIGMAITPRPSGEVVHLTITDNTISPNAVKEMFEEHFRESRQRQRPAAPAGFIVGDKGWMGLWSAWGLIVGGLIVVLDGNYWAAAIWILAGAVVGIFGLQFIRIVFGEQYFNWFKRLNPGKELPPTEIESLGHLVFAVPIVGVFLGILTGPIGGAVAALDTDCPFTTAAAGALMGLFILPMIGAWIYALTIFLDGSLPRLIRLRLWLISPLLIAPAAWHCLRTKCSSLPRRF